MDNEKKFHYPCLLLWSILLNYSKRQLSKNLKNFYFSQERAGLINVIETYEFHNIPDS